jgi:hypothetical protein
MLGNTSNQEGLPFHEWKIQMDYLKAIYLRYKKVSKPLRARTLGDNKQIFQKPRVT